MRISELVDPVANSPRAFPPPRPIEPSFDIDPFRPLRAGADNHSAASLSSESSSTELPPLWERLPPPCLPERSQIPAFPGGRTCRANTDPNPEPHIATWVGRIEASESYDHFCTCHRDAAPPVWAVAAACLEFSSPAPLETINELHVEWTQQSQGQPVRDFTQSSAAVTIDTFYEIAQLLLYDETLYTNQDQRLPRLRHALRLVEFTRVWDELASTLDPPQADEAKMLREIDSDRGNRGLRDGRGRRRGQPWPPESTLCRWRRKGNHYNALPPGTLTMLSPMSSTRSQLRFGWLDVDQIPPGEEVANFATAVTYLLDKTVVDEAEFLTELIRKGKRAEANHRLKIDVPTSLMPSGKPLSIEPL